MKKPTPTNTEVPFKFEELFFSTTDKKGVIRFGNDVFINISGYPRETILGAPHNIIRHPDMPKSVFKLFWDKLKANQPIGAYVKNMAADGRYYWVYAFAFPISDGYLSIRFKPSSELFSKVQEIYELVLSKEKTLSLDASFQFLLDTIHENGFLSYEDFMVQSVVAELKSREDHLKVSHHDNEESDQVVKNISDVTRLISQNLDQSFGKISLFQESSRIFTDNIAKMKAEFKKLHFLSINMSTLANKLGDEAATLSVISKEFSTLAALVEKQMMIFSDFTQNLLGIIQHASLELAALKNQMIMVDFFVKESIETMNFSGMVANKESFTTLFSQSITNLSHELITLKNELKGLDGQLVEIRKLASGMEVIKQTGAIEAARKDEIQKAFYIYLVEMTQFMNVLKNAVSELNIQRQGLDHHLLVVHDSATSIKDNINELFRLALMKSA